LTIRALLRAVIILSISIVVIYSVRWYETEKQIAALDKVISQEEYRAQVHLDSLEAIYLERRATLLLEKAALEEQIRQKR
jgi:cell division protein FtsL